MPTSPASATSRSSPTSTTARRRCADRILELTGAVDARDMRAQYLDSMDIERERGITIKVQNVRRALEGPRPQPHRHARPRRLRLRGGRSRWPPARASCCSSTPPRASRPRRWPTATSPSSTTSRSWPPSTRSTCPAADPDRYAGRDREGARHPRRRDPAHQRQDGEGVPELLDAVVERIPPPTGDADAPLQALIFDSPLRPVPRRGRSVRVDERHACAPAPGSASCRPAPSTTPTRSASARPMPTPGRRRSAPARSATSSPASRTWARPARARPSPRPPGPPPSRSRATATRSRWCSAGSTRSTATSSPTCARRSRSCGSTTRSFTLRARDVGRPRLRLPLRLPRPAAHGDRAGAARARVRPQPHRHRAVGRVPGAHAPTATCIEVDNPSEHAAGRRRSTCIEEPYLHGHDPHAHRVHGHAHGAVPDPAGRDGEDGVPVARAGRAASTGSRWPRSSSTSSTS